MLITHQLSYAYPRGEELHFPDLHCEKGDKWLLLGRSGSGKTTLLHLLCGLMRPKSGNIRIGDQDITQLSGAALDAFRGQQIGIVFQQPHFVQALTVLENLTLVQHLAGKKVDPGRARELLDRLGIGHKVRSKPQQLSQGERQRVAIARALMNQPQLILADEPTSALDDPNCREVVGLLEEQATREQATLLIVTHDNRLKDLIPNRIELSAEPTIKK